VLAHRDAMMASGDVAARRRAQQVKWMWAMLEERLFSRLRTDPAIRARVKETEADVAAGRMTPTLAADALARLLEN
jgi:LAO/AO transport system kinase